MPVPVAVAGQRANYDVGTVHSPVGVTPPGGVPAIADPQKEIVTDPATVQPPVSFIAEDGTPLTPSITEWNAMTGQQQAAHLAAVNAHRASLPPDTKAGRGSVGVGLVPRGGRPRGREETSPISIDDYKASLPRDPMPRKGRPAATAAAPAAPAANVTKNTQALLAKIPQASQTPQGQKIMEFARAVGVNPAVAMATYGMESSFGTQNRSWADAKRTGSGWGVLQVTPDTARRVTGYFSDPKVLAKYPNEANNLNALVQMAQGDPNSEEAQIAAGILQMKYIQDIGIADEKLMGAAYQANPHEVLKRGAPVDATDGDMSNSDYSSNWNALFSQATAQLGGGASNASSPAPQPAAPAGVTVASTGNKGFDSRVKFAIQKAPSEYDFQTQQLMQSREQHIRLLQQKEAMMQAEQQRIEQAYTNASQRFAAHKAAGDVVGMTAAMDELSATQRLNDDLQSRSFEFAASAQAGINEYNNQLITNEADRAVRDLANGDPTRASSLLSQAGGSQVVFQRSTTGGFVKIGPDGRYVVDDKGNAQQFTAADVAYELYSVADRAKAAAIDAGRASADSKTAESRLKSEEEAVKIIGELKKIEVQSLWDIEKELKKQNSDIAAVQDTPDGGKQVFYKGPEGKVVTISPEALVKLSNGEEIPVSNIKVDYSGVKTNG
jgi:hypothetical protein